MKKIMVVPFLIAVIYVSSQNIFEPNFIPGIFEITKAAAMVNVPDQNFSVKTFVKEDDVYIECYLKDYRFSQSNKKDLASIIISIDGKKHRQQKTAAFIIKNLSNGKHKIKLELINEKGGKTGLTKEFEVHIQSAI